MIVLPYAFLMNTSHNKDRVMEHGWKHVFQNLLGISSQNNNPNSQTSGGIQSLKSRSSKIQGVKRRQTIFSISSSSASRIPPNDPARHKKLSFENEPCSSMGKKGTGPLNSRDITVLDVNELPQQEDKEEKTVIHMLVQKMIRNIQVEQKYMEYFKEFVSCQYEKKDKETRFDFQFELLPNHIPDCATGTRYNKVKGKYSKKSSGKSSRKTQLKVDRNEDEMMNEPQNEIPFKGEKKDRIMIRLTILTQISAICKNDDMYESLIEQLIDAEESFVQE